jgi:hypothetical protein
MYDVMKCKIKKLEIGVVCYCLLNTFAHFTENVKLTHFFEVFEVAAEEWDLGCSRTDCQKMYYQRSDHFFFYSL